MRIALVHPTYWPEVRRGSERLIHDLGVALTERGHEVTVLTSHRARRQVRVEDGIEVVRSWRPPELPGLKLHEYHLPNAVNVFVRLARGQFDLAHAFFPPDAYAAVRARRFGGPPVVATLHGIPVREYLVARRYRLEMLEAIAKGADECSVLSRAAAAPFRNYLLREPHVLPGGVDLQRFTSGEDPDRRPTLLFPASIGDPRKRGALLVAAFASARARHPSLRLVVAPGVDPFMSGEERRLPPGCEVALPDSPDALADEYARATATVLPSVHEAFGLVLVESMAVGTPVLAARSGAAPELVEDGRTGILVEPDDEGALADGIDAVLALAADPETPARCKARARDFDWRSVVERYEDVYQLALTRSSRRR